jgi:P pilus assembly chaperone PapD
MKKLLLVLIAVAPLAAAGAGIQVSPSKLKLEIAADNPAAAELAIGNPTADVQLFEVYPDDFAGIISANPSSFTLEAGAAQTVRITVFPGKLKGEETLATNISVLAKPLADSRFQANSGVKIPIIISSMKPAQNRRLIFWAGRLGLAAAVVFMGGVWLAAKKRARDRLTKSRPES